MCVRWWTFIILIYSFLLLTYSNEYYLNQFAVQSEYGRQFVEEIAANHGFKIEREYPSINVFILSHPSVHHRTKRHAEDILNKLIQHPKVKHAQQELELEREKRSNLHDKQLELPVREIKDNSIYHRVENNRIELKDNIPGGETVLKFNDPCEKDQWYIKNTGQSGGVKDVDLNIMGAWEKGYTGTGVVCSILDDGVDHTHTDLKDNYDPKASTDFNDNNSDPTPDKSNYHNSHGTRCAGVIGAKANNGVCGVGIAYTAKIGGIRVLDGKVTDSLEAAALNFNLNYIDIFSSSWGPRDNGKTMDGPKHFAKEALRKGVTEGRNGKGVLYVWATGNGGANDDDCSADSYVSSIETLSVGSISDKGRRTFFMENCTSTIAVVPSGGEEVQGEEKRKHITKLKVITTDINNGCIENFQGTSSAAPIAAGCMALLLQANPSLGWRDAQHIVIKTARIPSVDTSWIINGAGLHVSRKFGYGVMDCGKMVEMAQNWNNVPEQHICTYERPNENKQIKSQHCAESQIYVDACKDDMKKRIDRLEHVQIHINLSHSRRGDIQVFLTSPAGTRSEMLSRRSHDDFKGKWDFTFMTLHSWDEYPEGLWKLQVCDNPGSSSRHNNHGWLSDWTLILYGTSGSRQDRMLDVLSRQQRAYNADVNEVVQIMDQEHVASRQLSIKRQIIPEGSSKESENEEKNLKDDQILRDLLNRLLDQDKFSSKRGNSPSQTFGNHGKSKDAPDSEKEDSKRQFNTKSVDDDTQLLINILKEITN